MVSARETFRERDQWSASSYVVSMLSSATTYGYSLLGWAGLARTEAIPNDEQLGVPVPDSNDDVAPPATSSRGIPMDEAAKGQSSSLNPYMSGRQIEYVDSTVAGLSEDSDWAVDGQ